MKTIDREARRGRRDVARKRAFDAHRDARPESKPARDSSLFDRDETVCPSSLERFDHNSSFFVLDHCPVSGMLNQWFAAHLTPLVTGHAACIAVPSTSPSSSKL